MAKKKNPCPIDKKRVFPKDIKLLEELEKVPPEEAFHNFYKLLDRAVHTPPFPLKSSRSLRKLSDKEKNSHQ